MNTDIPLFRIKRSFIHSRGLFANTDIEEGTHIIQYLGEKITKKESERRAIAWDENARTRGFGLVYIFELNKRYDIDGNVPYNPAKYINHHCDPNCEALNIDNEIWIIAKKAIKKGEELTYDYGYDLEHFMDHSCKCGAQNCVGYIVRSDLRKRVRQILNRSSKGPCTS